MECEVVCVGEACNGREKAGDGGDEFCVRICGEKSEWLEWIVEVCWCSFELDVGERVIEFLRLNDGGEFHARIYW